jgi:hypothetical protein
MFVPTICRLERRAELPIYLFAYAQGMSELAAQMLLAEPLFRPSGFWRPTEIADMQAFLADFSSSLCRMYWQLGYVDKAQEQLAEQPGCAAWKAIRAFLSQEQPVRQGVAPQQTPLFDRFPGWLDQLVSQVVGRKVRLAIEVEELPGSSPTIQAMQAKPYAEVYLVEADGSKVPFNWGAGPRGSSSSSTGTNATAAATLTSSISSSEAAPMTLMPGPLPDEVVYEKYLSPGVAASAEQMQASAPADHSSAAVTPTNATASNSQQGTPRGGSGPAQAQGHSSDSSSGMTQSAAASTVDEGGNSSQAAAAGGSSSTTSSTSRAPQAPHTRLTTSSSGNSMGFSFGGITVQMMTRDGLEDMMRGARWVLLLAAPLQHCVLPIAMLSGMNMVVIIMSFNTVQQYSSRSYSKSGSGPAVHKHHPLHDAIHRRPDGPGCLLFRIVMDDDGGVDPEGEGAGYDPLRGISISRESLTAAVRALGLDDMLQDLFSSAGQGAASAGRQQQGTSSTQPPAVPASTAGEPGGTPSGSGAAAAPQDQAAPASSATSSRVAAGGTSSAAAAGTDGAVDPGCESGPSDGDAAAVDSTASRGRRKEPRPCAMCGQLFTKLQRCSKCKQVLYCSREHQVAHWKLVHKLECQGSDQHAT